ncbi:MAG: hypothetical protein HQ581_25130, partial [Planctomycetes bacterium]|nr:hypothetical protein [Planctomycetota bacterium]
MAAVWLCIVVACVVLKDHRAWGQQAAPLPPASPLLRQASATQDVAADDTIADGLLNDTDDILSLADESLENLSRHD